MPEDTPENVDFSGLVAGLATSAVAVMGQVESLLESGRDPLADAQDEAALRLEPEEVSRRVNDGLAGARQLIDTLAVLQVKTQGNLTSEEAELLGTAVSELRIQFVGLSSRQRPAGTQEADAS